MLYSTISDMPHTVSILMSDTGGGHRSASEAIREALTSKSDYKVQVKLIDVLSEYAPYPLSHLPVWYPVMASRGMELWRRGFNLSNGALRTKALNYAAWPYISSAIRRLIREQPSDLIVSTHPLLVSPVLQGLGKRRPPFITVVTDLVSTHAWWFDKRADLTMVPTKDACHRALSCGLDARQVKVVGLPVSQQFCHSNPNQDALRRELGWRLSIDTVLLLGGADGIGPLREVAYGLAHAGLPIQLAVVCGRNERLRAYLESQTWPLETHVYGFVSNMPTMIMAADLVVTKAGPSSIIEALTCGRPLVLYGAIPGQEEGNIHYAVEHGAGLWAPSPERVVAAVQEILSTDPDRMVVMAANARQLARPGAARAIAQEICSLLPRPTLV